MFIGEARAVVKDAEGFHIMKRSVYLGETKQSVKQEVERTFSPLFDIVNVRIKWYFSSQVMERLLIGFPELTLSSEDKNLSLIWHER